MNVELTNSKATRKGMKWESEGERDRTPDVIGENAWNAASRDRTMAASFPRTMAARERKGQRDTSPYSSSSIRLLLFLTLFSSDHTIRCWIPCGGPHRRHRRHRHISFVTLFASLSVFDKERNSRHRFSIHSISPLRGWNFLP